MAVGNHTESLSVGGRLMQRNVDLTADADAGYGGASAPITLVTPSATTSWVKTSASVAACDVAAGSNVATGKVDCFFTAGRRYGVDCTRTTNALALTGGTGTDYPASADTTVVIANQEQINVAIDGDLAEAVGVLSTTPAHIDFQDVSSNSICPLTLVANEPNMWDSHMATNIYTGAVVTKAKASNGTLKWVTSTVYSVGNVVQNTSILYKCLVAHTSGTFATDLAAGKWVVVTSSFEIIVLQDSTP